MRHGKKVNHLSRKAGHRRALLTNMASQLIMYKRIRTTVAKAKALRVYFEPIVTRSKEDTTHSRRMAFRYLQSKEAVKELFSEVSAKVGDRPGGYTRIIRTGVRAGDAADMAIIELVDFNDVYVKEDTKKGKTRRSRRGGKSGGAKAGAAAATTVTTAQAKAQKEEATENSGAKTSKDEEE